MKPIPISISDDDVFLSSLVACIRDIDCSDYFLTHHGKSQSEKKQLVAGFQKSVESALKGSIQDVEWKMEHLPSGEKRDRIDIFGKGAGFVVVLELDASRADQVAKKFVSRIALFPKTNVYFVSLCYPGTKKMNQPECEKYFGYCSALALRIGNHYAGFVVKQNPISLESCSD